MGRDLGRTFRTVRHLKLSQVCWRVRYFLKRKRPPRAPRVAKHVQLADDAPTLPHLPLARSLSDLELLEHLARGEFAHLNGVKRLGYDNTDWMLGPQDTDRLWIVTLHYHEWALSLANIVRSADPEAERASEVLRHYLASWIKTCTLQADGSRALAWNAYAIATRLRSWSKLLKTLPEGELARWGSLRDELLQSMWAQAAYLRDNLEYDLRANHLLRDALGLAYAGRALAGKSAGEWLAKGTRLGLQQIAEQVLSDGGHFERSVMYHMHVMEDVMDLALLVRSQETRDALIGTWHRMASFLQWHLHPDGNIVMFNDAAINGGPDPTTLLEVGKAHLDGEQGPSPKGTKTFGEFGTCVHHDFTWSVFMDAGPVGPDYQPGHAHADTLTIECSFRGQRLVVDPGTFHYDVSEERKYDRSTAAHNTVTINGLNSTEVWHIFRVGNRARSVIGSDIIGGGHMGYQSLNGSPRHQRAIQIDESDRLIITDFVKSTSSHLIQGSFLLPPSVQATASSPSSFDLQTTGGPMRVQITGPAGLECDIETGRIHPEFGQAIEGTRIAWRATAQARAQVVSTFAPL